MERMSAAGSRVDAIPRPRVVDVAGRAVGFYEYGDPTGAPVMVLHGTPACGAGFAGWGDAPARTLGLRLLAPDRPGVGLTARRDGYRVADYADDVAALADTLGIDGFAVWGYSGGGPYALACAARLGDRVRRTAVCAGAGQVGAWAEIGDFEQTDRQMLGLAPRRPLIARALLGSAARIGRVAPKLAYNSFAKQLSPADREVAATLGPPRIAIALFTEAFLRGASGAVADYVALAAPWGFDVATIATPVHVWHGDADPMVPLAHSQSLVERVPHAELTVWPGEGHLGTVTHAREILDDLTRASA
jgi:pimeloyl-ACP methyl ester carboxylesterase